MHQTQVAPRVRTRWHRIEQQRDEELLAWLARFRFVTATILETRFGVSERMCRRRLARLEAGGFVVSHQAHQAAPKLYAVGPAGRTLLGAGQRRAPRWDTQATHELAIGRLVAELETAHPNARVLTERDCRRAETDGLATYSVACIRDGLPVRRWPDVVTEGERERVAVEIELAPKTTSRLHAILLGYLTDRRYHRVELRCGSAALERRMRKLVADLTADDVFDVARL